MRLSHAAKPFARAVLVLLLALSPALGQTRAPSVYTVSNVKAQAEAANAVEAKKLATLDAETRAFNMLVTRLADFRAAQRVPQMAPEDIERLVSDIDVRGEGVSGTSYVAVFGVTFSERAISALFSQYGIVPITDRAPEILIVPVYVEYGTAKSGDRNAWRSALTSLDLTHALVPAKVAPTRDDLTAAIANAYIANPTAGIDALKTQYRVSQLMLAVADLDASGETITVKLAGTDVLGPFAVQRKIKTREGVDESLMQEAARVAFDSVQERWKLTRGAYIGAVTDNAGPSAGAGFSGATGGMVSLQVTAQYSGLKEWQSIRGRLQGIPGIQNWDLRSVNPRSAQIGFDFPGGAERLTAMASQQGLSVENGPEGLVVKTR